MINLKLADEDFIRLTSYIKTHFGINLTQKRLLIEGRLGNTITSMGFKDFKSYIDFALNDPTGNETITLINKLTTNHTFFMREPMHFEFFRETVLPYLEQTVKDKDFRIWSAACSSGDEPFTLAMTMDDYFGNRKSQFDCKILATDISENVLSKAREGIYPADSLTDLPAEWKSKYFKRLPDGRYEIIDRIKDEVVFREFNLMDKIVYKKPFDLILCRNVMIYFDMPTKVSLVNRFYDATKPGGYFFIGHAETISKEDTKYKYVKPAIYRK